MTPAGTNLLLAHADAAPADVVTKSCRFSEATQHWLRGGTGSVGSSNGTWTLSYWIKRAALEGGGRSHDDHNFNTFYWTGLGSSETALGFQHGGANAGKMRFQVGASAHYSSGVFRDLSAWAHILISVSSGTATIKYNGETVISGVTGIPTWGTYLQFSRWSTDDYSSFGGYLADAYGVDGTALDYTDFTSTDATTGQLKPIAYSSSVGTNGFHLDFEDSSDIGKDVSGEGNDFTEEGGLSTWDIVNDTPTDNYCVLNALQNTSSSTLSEGNLKSTWVSGSGFNEPATIGATSGKYYFEVYKPANASPNLTANQQVGIARADTANTATLGAASANTVAYMANSSGSDTTGFLVHNGITTAFGSRWDDAAYIIQCAFDADTGKVWFGRDNTWQDDTSGNTPDVAAGTYPAVTLSGDEALMPAIRAYGAYMVFNGGSDPTFAGYKSGGATSEFYYTPPTGFSALSTGNLPTPTIAKPAEHFDAKIWTGNGSSSDRDITGLSFEPDLVWYKSRTDGTEQCWQDSVRGWGTSATGTKFGSSSTQVENGSYFETQYGYISASVSGSGTANGFTVAQGPSGLQDMVHTNMSAKNYVAWNWKKSATAGFNIVGWTGDDDGFSGGTQAVAHGLGVAPEMVIAKNRTDEAGGNGNWIVYHKDTTSGDLLKLNSTDGEFTPNSTLIGSIGSTNVSFGNDSLDYEYLNSDNSFGSGTPDTYIGYFFASVESYSKVGSFSGSSTAFIYTGFRPSFILAKRSDATGGNWLMFDDKREGYNVDNDDLMANSSASEATTDHIDILSNGFKIRTSDADLNGGTLIYLAVAKNPFKYASAR